MFSNFSRVVVVRTNPIGYIRGDFHSFNNIEYLPVCKHQIKVCVIKFALTFNFSFIFVKSFTYMIERGVVSILSLPFAELIENADRVK